MKKTLFQYLIYFLTLEKIAFVLVEVKVCLLCINALGVCLETHWPKGEQLLLPLLCGVGHGGLWMHCNCSKTRLFVFFFRPGNFIASIYFSHIHVQAGMYFEVRYLRLTSDSSWPWSSDFFLPPLNCVITTFATTHSLCGPGHPAQTQCWLGQHSPAELYASPRSFRCSFSFFFYFTLQL